MENYSVLKMLVLDEILGMRPTFEMSRHLGFTFDKYKRWMNNEKILRWNEFTELCEKAGLNLQSALEMIKLPKDEATSSEKLFLHLKDYNFLKTNQEVSNFLKCHVSVVKRYSVGHTVPDVETIFKLISFRANGLSLFINRLFANEVHNPLLKKWIDTDAESVRFETKYPMSSMISAALSLEDYKNRKLTTEQWLAQLLNFDVSEIQKTIISMLNSKIITQTEEDKFQVNHTTTNLDGVTVQEIVPFIQYLNKRLIDKLEKRKDSRFKSQAAPGAMEYRVFPASLESIDKINSILNKAGNEILKTLEEDTNPKIEARTILLQHFSLTK